MEHCYVCGIISWVTPPKNFNLPDWVKILLIYCPIQNCKHIEKLFYACAKMRVLTINRAPLALNACHYYRTIRKLLLYVHLVSFQVAVENMNVYIPSFWIFFYSKIIISTFLKFSSIHSIFDSFPFGKQISNSFIVMYEIFYSFYTKHYDAHNQRLIKKQRLHRLSLVQLWFSQNFYLSIQKILSWRDTPISPFLTNVVKHLLFNALRNILIYNKLYRVGYLTFGILIGYKKTYGYVFKSMVLLERLDLSS